jgi:alpha-N-arabinofuranosidase
MPTFGSWERTVLEHTYDDVDFISCHVYYEVKDGDMGSFLASAVNMDNFIESVVATADHVKAVRRSDKVINISFDEWNVWYQSRYRDVDQIEGIENWPEAPRLLEDAYSVADAVVVGNLLISLLNHADRVTSASLAQLVNVIAPIMTEPGGDAWRQTTFFPFAVTSKLATGTALEVKLASDSYETDQYGVVNVVDAAATTDGDGTSVFLVNRSLTEATTVTIDVRALPGLTSATAQTIADDDIYAANTLSDQNRVGLVPNESIVFVDGTMEITLPPVSWTAVSLS